MDKFERILRRIFEDVHARNESEMYAAGVSLEDIETMTRDARASNEKLVPLVRSKVQQALADPTYDGSPITISLEEPH